MTTKELRIRELERAKKLADYRIDNLLYAAAALEGQVFRIRMPTQIQDPSGVTICSTGTISGNVKCNGINQSGATVNITGPGTFSVSLTTDGSGNYSTSIVGFEPGLYSFTVSKAGFTTVTGTLNATCGPNVKNFTIAGTTATFVGNVLGCNGIALTTGATVEVFQGAVLIGTTTSDGSGHYSITVSGTGTFTLKVSKPPRFLSGTRTVSSFCNATVTTNLDLISLPGTPAPGYVCTGCTGTPTLPTLNLTVPFGNSPVTMVLTSPPQWDGVSLWTTTVRTDCAGAAATQSVHVPWTFNDFGVCRVQYSYWSCNPLTSGIPCATGLPLTETGTGYPITSSSFGYYCGGGSSPGAFTIISEDPLWIDFTVSLPGGGTATATLTE